MAGNEIHLYVVPATNLLLSGEPSNLTCSSASACLTTRFLDDAEGRSGILDMLIWIRWCPGHYEGLWPSRAKAISKAFDRRGSNRPFSTCRTSNVYDFDLRPTLSSYGGETADSLPWILKELEVFNQLGSVTWAVALLDTSFETDTISTTNKGRWSNEEHAQEG